MVLRLLRVLVVLAAAACTRQAVDLLGRACSGYECTDGFVCNPLTSMCSTPVHIGCSGDETVCPSTTQDGDACTEVGSFLPCAEGTSGCGGGCRLCDTDHTWGMCSDCRPSNNGVEVCDGFDNDCNGLIDDGDPIEGCTDSYVDADHDGFGAGDPICRCGVPYGRSRIPGDPDDTNPNISPDTGEVCDGLDNNHDGSPLTRETDDDGDGYVECTNWVGNVPGVFGGGDCDDNDDQTHPNAQDELCDGVANRCTPAIPANELDADGDGYVVCSGWVDRHLLYSQVRGGGDCAPSDPKIHPGAAEIPDGKDNDCDGKTDECLADCDCGSRLVSCYPMDSDASDDGPAGVNASLVSGNNASITTGRVGGAYSIPSSDPLQGPSSSAQDLARFTMSVFIRPTSFPGSGNTWREVLDVQSEYGMKIAKGGDLQCFYADSGGYVTVGAGSVLTTNTWQHVGCTYDRSNLVLYVNGDVKASQPTSTAVRTNKTGPLRIGSNSTESGDTAMEAFVGAIDQLKIFKEALTDKEMCGESLRTDCP